MKLKTRLIFDEEAASTVEYAFLLAGIALVVAASIVTLGQAVNALYIQASSLFQ